MRLLLWPLIGLWVLKWSLSAGMAMPVHGPVPDSVHDPLHATTANNANHHAEHAGASPALAPDCHGSWATQAERAKDAAQEGSDVTHCTSHADCHHCCPLAEVNWANIGKPEAPTVHPSRHVHSWHSTSWMPGLRPPKT